MGKLRRQQRNYHGNPLAYFEEHKDEYDGMGREDLSLNDCGMYRSLLRAGQLEQAISFVRPTGRKPLSNDEINKIVDLYPPNNGNACQASKNSLYSTRIIIKYWRNAGFEIRKIGRPKTI